MDNNIKRKFAGLVANMLDAERRGATEEAAAFKNMVNEWQAKFNLSLDVEYEPCRRYDTHIYKAIKELQTQKKRPGWFSMLSRIIQNTFGVPAILIPRAGTTMHIVCHDEELLKEIFDFADVIQQEMYLFCKTNTKINNKSNYYKGFMRGVWDKLNLSNTSNSLVLRSHIQKAVDWYSGAHSKVTKTKPVTAYKDSNFENGVHDGKYRGTRLGVSPIIKLLNS